MAPQPMKPSLSSISSLGDVMTILARSLSVLQLTLHEALGLRGVSAFADLTSDATVAKAAVKAAGLAYSLVSR